MFIRLNPLTEVNQFSYANYACTFNDISLAFLVSAAGERGGGEEGRDDGYSLCIFQTFNASNVRVSCDIFQSLSYQDAKSQLYFIECFHI